MTHRVVRRYEPVASRVSEGYYLSGWADSYSHYTRAGCTNTRIAVLDVTCELPRMLYSDDVLDVEYRCVPVLDRLSPSLPQLEAAVQWCVARRAEGRDVVVHCAFGHGRSATCLIAVLVRAGVYESVEEAENSMRAMRPHVELTDVQYDILTEWLAVHNADKRE